MAESHYIATNVDKKGADYVDDGHDDDDDSDYSLPDLIDLKRLKRREMRYECKYMEETDKIERMSDHGNPKHMKGPSNLAKKKLALKYIKNEKYKSAVKGGYNLNYDKLMVNDKVKKSVCNYNIDMKTEEINNKKIEELGIMELEKICDENLINYEYMSMCLYVLIY